jgi:hypothetical protein
VHMLKNGWRKKNDLVMFVIFLEMDEGDEWFMWKKMKVNIFSIKLMEKTKMTNGSIVKGPK